MYAKIRRDARKIPLSTWNLVLRDIEARLAKSTQRDFLPRSPPGQPIFRSYRLGTNFPIRAYLDFGVGCRPILSKGSYR